MEKSARRFTALVLPGAVARGAFEAGVIDTLVQNQVRIDRIVATSSGALNGIVYAAALRAGREKEWVAQLVESWIRDGQWNRALSLSPWTSLTGRGLSNGDGLLRMMRALIRPVENSARRDVDLRIIVSPLNGVMGKIGDHAATTYEKMFHFEGRDFDTTESLERIFKVVCAACAFPGLFCPVDLENLGPCIDGGAVNNAPIRYALRESDVEHVVIAVPFPAVMKAASSLRGLGLLTHLAEILINERLYRDLSHVELFNQELQALESLVEDKKLSAEQLFEIKRVLQIRKVKVSQIRPREVPKQSAFSGFFKKGDRVKLVEEGRQAAREFLASDIS